MPTPIVRKLVAVGTERLCSIAVASIATGPRSGVVTAPLGSAGNGAAVEDDNGFAVPLSSAASTSCRTTRPSGPLPRIVERSTLCRSATRRACGVASADGEPLGAGDGAATASGFVAGAGCGGALCGDGD